MNAEHLPHDHRSRTVAVSEHARARYAAFVATAKDSLGAAGDADCRHARADGTPGGHLPACPAKLLSTRLRARHEAMTHVRTLLGVLVALAVLLTIWLPVPGSLSWVLAGGYVVFFAIWTKRISELQPAMPLRPIGHLAVHLTQAAHHQPAATAWLTPALKAHAAAMTDLVVTEHQVVARMSGRHGRAAAPELFDSLRREYHSCLTEAVARMATAVATVTVATVLAEEGRDQTVPGPTDPAQAGCDPWVWLTDTGLALTDRLLQEGPADG